jgi:hypothetical protein
MPHGGVHGGEMIKRADGSYSRRGFWDNIRDAAGSGNPVTPEMRATERKLKKAQVGLEQDESSFVSSDQGVPVVGAPTSPMMGAISPTMNNHNITNPNQQPETVTANLGAGEAVRPENFKDYETIKMPDEKKEDPNNITPAYTNVHSGISAVQLKDEKDARKQQRWLNNLSFGASPAQTGAGAFLRGVVGLSTIPRTVSNTIKGTRTHLAQGYDASGNKLGDPQYIDHSDWKDMQQQQRKIARNQRREDRMDTGIGRMTNRIVETPERAYHAVKGMFQKEEGGEWNPFEDNRPKVTMNIHKPLFQNGGDWQKFLDEKNYTGSEDFLTVLRDYDAWKNQQNSNDPSNNSSINNTNQSNTQYGTDTVNTPVAMGTLGSLINARRGVEGTVTTGYDQMQNLSTGIGTFGTMGQEAMNPADPRSGGPLAGSFANQRPGMTGTQTGVGVTGYLAGEAGDKGMSTFSKYGGSYEVGGEYDLTDEELMMLKSMGYEYEALRK